MAAKKKHAKSARAKKNAVSLGDLDAKKTPKGGKMLPGPAGQMVGGVLGGLAGMQTGDIFGGINKMME